MRLLLAANNQATRQNEIVKSYLQLGSSSNRYASRLPQQETKSSTKQLPPTDPILGPENFLKTGFAQKGLPSCPSGRHKPQSFIEKKGCASATLIQQTSKNESTFTVAFLGTVWRYQKWDRKIGKSTATRATNKTWQLRLVKEKTYRVGTEEAQYGDCNAAPPRQHSPIRRYSALLRRSVVCFNSITQCNWHDIETMAE